MSAFDLWRCLFLQDYSNFILFFLWREIIFFNYVFFLNMFLFALTPIIYYTLIFLDYKKYLLSIFSQYNLFLIYFTSIETTELVLQNMLL